MSKGSLPALYVPPVACDRSIVLALELLTLATKEPRYKALLSRAACHLLDAGGKVFDDAQDVRAADAAPRGKKQKRAKRDNGGAEQQGMPSESFQTGDVSIDLTSGAEAITYKGKTIEVAANQAALAKLLAAAFGQTIGRDHLLKKIFPNRSGDSADVAINGLRRDLDQAVRAIGLEVFNVRGVGAMLRPLEAQ